MNFEKKDIIAGNSIFTVSNEETGNHFTFKVKKVEDKELYFVSVLNGPDNYSDYMYMGIISNGYFKLTGKSKVGKEAISYKAFNWLWNTLSKNVSIPSNVKVQHEGRCFRCGRKLTHPESIETGYGPTCLGKS